MGEESLRLGKISQCGNTISQDGIRWLLARANAAVRELESSPQRFPVVGRRILREWPPTDCTLSDSSECYTLPLLRAIRFELFS
jgi:hypothetical protein